MGGDAVMSTTEHVEPKPRIQSAFDGQVLRLDSLKGIEPGGWGLTWKACLNRMVVLVVGMTPKDGDGSFDLDAALKELGYVKQEAPQ